jgi:acetoin utilization deacetylase AcuC-like enzyme
MCTYIEPKDGNGSEDIVKALNRPDALFFASTHLYDGEFYPGSGRLVECFNI